MNSWLRVGANIDYYSERGILAGPTSQYVYHSPTQSIRGALTTGYINDKGDASELKFDNLNRPIEQNRGFAEWRHKHTQGERFAATASLSYWEDSEVTRDFRDDIFNEKRRSMKIRPKNGRKRKMKNLKILTLALGESIRFRERE